MSNALKTLLKRYPRAYRVASTIRSEIMESRQIGIWLRQRPQRIEAYLQSHGVAKLNIGCGPAPMTGWLNADISPVGDTGIYLDARESLPFRDRVFDYIFSEHMIEHILLPEAEGLLRESFRVLKPGGKIRIATPDLMQFIGLFNEMTPEAKTYARLYKEKFPEMNLRSPAMILDNIMRNFAHRFVFDEPTLRASFEAAGLRKIHRCQVGISDDPHFAKLEKHGRAVGDEMNRFETMVLEAERSLD